MTVTNRGKAPGAEIVQVYFHFSPPANEPRRVLRGFKKTRRLEPGEAVTVTFFPRETDLSVYQVGGAWVPQQNVSMQFGASSADIRRSIVLNPPPPSTSTTTTTTTATTTTATATTTRTTSTRTTTTATVTMTTTTFTTSTSTSSKTRTATTTTVTFTTSTSTMTTTTTTTFTFTTTSSLAGPAPWLYCITLLNPGSYEVELAKVQYQKRAGMFQCTGFTVFSNIDIVLSTPPAPIVRTEVIPGSIRVGYGGPTNNALNIEVFVRVWRRVFADGHYKKYDWTVKLDLDTVFLPERLRIHLVAHPSWTPMYINNCQWELHGPIEVLSNRAMQMYDGGMENCVASKVTNWQTSGEDVFVRDCMDFLKITRVDDFGLLSEIACGENPSPCDSGKVAFHPFKSSPSWLDCWAQAGGQRLFNGINV